MHVLWLIYIYSHACLSYLLYVAIFLLCERNSDAYLGTRVELGTYED